MPKVSSRGSRALVILLGVAVVSAMPASAAHASAAHARATDGRAAHPSATPPGPHPDGGRALGGFDPGDPPRDVIVVLRDQHTDLAPAKDPGSARIQANRREQSRVMITARGMGVRAARAFDTLNGFAATVTPEQATRLAADPDVAAVYPDLEIAKPSRPVAAASAATTTTPASAATITTTTSNTKTSNTKTSNTKTSNTKTRTAGPDLAGHGICPSDPAKPLLEPEALQVTNTAFTRPLHTAGAEHRRRHRRQGRLHRRRPRHQQPRLHPGRRHPRLRRLPGLLR